ncbi:hypothetical protein DOTSEDRAFT_30967 [Dothistroma septosporum NZE10]|uniref:Uncharacterized protein n=1 Tax=Dothistroma septosporum (strain NZE10 / CBS 128990) TaxID=675120 RepID=N1Q213_DOTSN|nr:hypothetical protein DOTSEDRAFT_30967 [Dothistroma septosporum NZE10]
MATSTKDGAAMAAHLEIHREPGIGKKSMLSKHSGSSPSARAVLPATFTLHKCTIVLEHGVPSDFCVDFRVLIASFVDGYWKWETMTPSSTKGYLPNVYVTLIMAYSHTKTVVLNEWLNINSSQ